MERDAADLDGAAALFRAAGLAALVIGAARAWPGLDGEAAEWAPFMALGTLYPPLLVLLAVGLPRVGERVSSVVPWALVALGVAACVGLIARFGNGRLVGLGLLNGAILWATSRRGYLEGEPFWPRIRAAAAGALVVVAAWVGAARLLWWAPLERMATASPSAALGLLGAMGLVAAFLRGRAGEDGAPPSRNRVVVAAGLVLLGLASLRLETLGAPVGDPAHRHWGIAAFHHWGVIAGPAALVRQGGWPLWDVPCQYGFLNTLLIAALPVRSAWQGLYVVHAAALFASAAVVFALLRGVRPGLLGTAAALALTFAAVFLLPGDTATLSGPALFPATGAYRYLWCYILVGIIARTSRPGPVRRRALAVGCVAWLLGTLWSSESAVFSTAIWLPALLALSLRRAGELGVVMLRERARVVLGWLAVPPLLWAITWASIAAYYAAFLGHTPDPRAFVDFALAARSCGVPLNPGGAVLVLLTVFCGVAAVGVAALGRDRRSLAIIGAALWAVWATSSYFVIRSVDALVVVQSPILLAAMAAALRAIQQLKLPGRSEAVLSAAFAPALGAVLMVGLQNPAELRGWSAAIGRGYVRDVDRRLPDADRDLVALLDRAGVGPWEPIAFVDDRPDPLVRNRLHNALGGRPVTIGGRARRQTIYREWLPIEPLMLYMQLPDDRRRVYLHRFVERSRTGGWLVESAGGDPETVGWIADELARTHRPTRTVESGGWRLVRYEWAGPGGEAIAGGRDRLRR